jgi:hypothetical protein
MKLLEDIAIWSQLRPKVVHSLPGRLRLRIGLLQNLPDDWLNVAEALERAIAAPEGVCGVQSDRRSGSLLIRYNTDWLTESDVLAYLHSLLELLRRNRDRLQGMTNGTAFRVAGRLESWIESQTRRRPLIDPNVKVPDEVWS